MSVSSFILERNRDLADLVFGADDFEPASACERANDERKARGLAPFIVAGAAVAVGGGLVGIDPVKRRAAGFIAALLFIAI